MSGTRFSLEVQPQIPADLKRLEDLANDLFYSWDRQVRRLYTRLDRDLWGSCGHNPKTFLRRVSQNRLLEAVEDRVFMEDFNRVLGAYDTYLKRDMHHDIKEHLDADNDLIAYFCAEFGFHESLPIYSGGLGILAGDHCKAASDLCVPFVAVGILYRQGYFTQTIDEHGNQLAHYHPTDFDQLPLQQALDNNGKPLVVEVDILGRKIYLNVWRAKAGHITLYLLDSDLEDNQEHDRIITHQLYGGDKTTRIQQEIVLGIAGVRALRALGIKPTVWHINEGHSAFQILERARECVQQGHDFATALEAVAAGTVFTTHTPVEAGHDIFEHDLISSYFREYIKELGLDMQQFLELGATSGNPGGFNQTALALRGSRHHNGVSRVHGAVASEMESYIWGQVPHEENPIGYVTNGVHLNTFLARDWSNLYDMRFGRAWRDELLNTEYWECIDEIPDHSYWSLRQSLKSELLENVRQRAILQYRRNGCSQSLIEKLTRHIVTEESDILMIGFARRFATYKRATLLFSDPERLKRLLNDPERPVLLIFSGKAHPNDLPGQELIRRIHGYSLNPDFIGRIILLEGYDLALARKLVTGVDVWLNTPQFPLEASGTSGQKAGMNGVINLSVLDGWWAEGYNGDNGWAITPHDPHFDADYRDHEEASELLDMLENQVIPTYYSRNSHGYSEDWVKISKASMKSSIPNFNAQRMVRDYVRNLYAPASQQSRVFSADKYRNGRKLAVWKEKVRQSWPDVALRRVDDSGDSILSGKSFKIKIAGKLGELTAEDVVLECVIGTQNADSDFVAHRHIRFEATGTTPNGEVLFGLNLLPPLPGLQFYKIRMYPDHELLSHPFEIGHMIWL
ncbi:MAG: alpha-glucan family phosphorylase [Gammaproteobacteria bacterium]|nr:MAG: alpha-glucan family phosphorylase [Gammaproteobacteria bacterium]